jgi:hypothetical protein
MLDSDESCELFYMCFCFDNFKVMLIISSCAK